MKDSEASGIMPLHREASREEQPNTPKEMPVNPRTPTAHAAAAPTNTTPTPDPTTSTTAAAVEVPTQQSGCSDGSSSATPSPAAKTATATPSPARDVTAPATPAALVNISGEPVLTYPPLPPGEDLREDGTPNYFNWKELFPELKVLVEGLADISAECIQVSNWRAWPEKHYEEGGEQDWKVFPFVHTFPAYDESRRTWIESTCAGCPTTTELLRRIPNIRTALFSRLGAGSRISGHRGWADLANHVLRCHLSLKVPTDGPCGLWVNGEVVNHAEGEIIVFDDSKLHRAFNNSTGDRFVLIVDILRPPGIALGTAEGGHTPELDSFIDAFR